MHRHKFDLNITVGTQGMPLHQSIHSHYMLSRSISTVINPGLCHTTDSYLVKFDLMDEKNWRLKWLIKQMQQGRKKL